MTMVVAIPYANPNATPIPVRVSPRVKAETLASGYVFFIRMVSAV